nr:cytochrome P450 4AV17 [Meteorus pulchricornis]
MMDSSTIFLSLTVGLFAIYYFFVKESFFNRHGIPHLKPFSFIWSMISMLVFRKSSFHDDMKNIYCMNENAKYIGLYHTSAPTILIRDLELIKNITIKNFDSFTDHGGFADPEHEPLFGKNLFFLRGKKWRETRNLLSPAFTLSKMKSMFKLMSDCAETFSNSIGAQCVDHEMEYDAKDIFTRYTNDTIATCAFGVAVDSMKVPNNEFYVLGRRATDLNGLNAIKMFVVKLFPTLTKIIGLKIVDAEVEKFFFTLVSDTIVTRTEQGITRPDVIQLMMEARDHKDNSKTLDLSIESMTSQAFVFFFGGFESTATLMCFVAHHLSIFPKVQRKLQDEIDQVMTNCNGEPTYESVNNMEYLDAIINETLRLYPINPAMDRVCTKSFELPPSLPESKPTMLKPGDTIWYPIAAMHRDPKYFPHPDEFDPERFIGDARAENNFNAYLPFGLGPRMCIGNRFALLEVKVLFLHLLTKFNITPGERMILPLRLSKKTINYMAEGGFWVNLKPRK